MTEMKVDLMASMRAAKDALDWIDESPIIADLAEATDDPSAKAKVTLEVVACMTALVICATSKKGTREAVLDYMDVAVLKLIEMLDAFEGRSEP